MTSARALLLLAAAVVPAASLRAPLPMRRAVLGASTLAAAPFASFASLTMEEIAARSNAQAEAVAAAKKAQEAAGDPVGDLFAGALNLGLSVAVLALVAFIVKEVFTANQDAASTTYSTFTRDTKDGYENIIKDKIDTEQ